MVHLQVLRHSTSFLNIYGFFRTQIPPINQLITDAFRKQVRISVG